MGGGITGGTARTRATGTTDTARRPAAQRQEDQRGTGRVRIPRMRMAAACLALTATATACSDATSGPRAASQAASGPQSAQPAAGIPTIPTPAAPGAQAASQSPVAAAKPTVYPSTRAAAAPLAKPRSMAALGDSITRGFDACSLPLKDCPSKSWATGDDVDSQAKRLGLPSNAVFNDARTGARMSELADQARVAVGQRVEYVTVLMGANDACRDKDADMTPVADYERQLRNGLDVLRQGLPGVHVLVVSVPDVGRLWEVARGESFARTVWSAADVCQSMLADPMDSHPDSLARRQRVRDRITAYNDVLRRVCGEWSGQCKYDGGAVNAQRFGKNDLSHWDWFHPSGQGQGVIADLTMREGFRWQ